MQSLIKARILFSLIFFTLTKSQQTNITTLSQISQDFQHLLTHHHPRTQNENLKFLSSVQQFSKQQEMGNHPDQKILLNVMSAAIVAKILKEMGPSDLSEPLPDIQQKIKSLEQDTNPLPSFTSEETTRLKNKINEQIGKICLLNQISISNSSSNQKTLSQQPQLTTLTLLQIYVCLTNPVQKFLEINSNLQVPQSLRFIESLPPNTTSTSQTHQFTWPSLKCRDALEEHFKFVSRSSNPALGQLINKYPDLAEEYEQVQSNFRHVADTTTTDSILSYLTLQTYFKAASEYEQSREKLIEKLAARNQADTLESPPDTSHSSLGPLTRRLYNAIISTTQDSLEIIDGQISDGVILNDPHIITDTLLALQSSNCVDNPTGDLLPNNQVHKLAKNYESLLNQLAFYRYSHQLSDLMANLNSPSPSALKVEVHENKLHKSLISLGEHAIRSSLLQIEYQRLTDKLSELAGIIDTTNNGDTFSTSRVKSYTFVLTESTCSPDNYKQLCYVINGKYPGPPIIVNQHDLLRVQVINKLSVHTTMHFHGILQKHSVESDGVSDVTQEPIPPNGTFTYEIQIGDQPSGTYMYHGHMGLDLIWIHGALIVQDNPEQWKLLGAEYAYDHDHSFILEEVFHESFEYLISGMVEQGIDDPPVTSFAINGRSYGMWDSNLGNATGYEVLTVEVWKTYRFRVINMAAGSMLQFTIENHNMTVIEMDGIVTEMVVTDRLEIHTGQRYSVLVKMDKQPGNYWVRARLMAGDEGGPDNGRALIHYDCAEEVEEGMKKQVFSEPSEPIQISGDGWILGELIPSGRFENAGVYDFPEKSDRRILIDMQMKTVDGPPRFLINGHKYVKHNGTLLGMVRGGNDLSGETHVVRVKKGEVIDLVFQNRVDDTGGCDEHPIHIHGHSFWVVGSGADLVDMDGIQEQLEMENASGNRRQFRDTFTLFPNSSVESDVSGTACGWGVVRFVADNPGLWLVHCHVTSHMILGKRFVIYEYADWNPVLANE